MKTLDILQKMTWNEYVNSEFPVREASNFGMEHMVKSVLASWGEYNPQVFICKEDPKYNYGLDFKVYLRYKLPEGLIIFSTISFGSSGLNNNSFMAVTSIEFFEGTDTQLDEVAKILDMPRMTISIYNDRGYRRDARKILAKSGMTFCTGY